jgi:hypothetical protein
MDFQKEYDRLNAEITKQQKLVEKRFQLFVQADVSKSGAIENEFNDAKNKLAEMERTRDEFRNRYLAAHAAVRPIGATIGTI